MDKAHILNEIKKAAEGNGGIPLGMVKFEEATGIRKNDWSGKYRIKWNDALVEAGFKPNQFLTTAYSEDCLLERFVLYIRELDHFPSEVELKIKRHNDKNFPALKTFNNRLGRKNEMVRKVVGFCEKHNEFSDVKEIALLICNTNEKKIDKEFR